MVDLSRVDYAGLTAIKTTRALRDPIIVHPATLDNDWKSTAPGEDLVFARLLQNLETDVDVPIKRATWAETAMYLSSVSLVVPLDRQGADMYKWSFYKYLERFRSMSREEAEEFLGTSISAPTDPGARDALASLRKKIKVDRDKWYLENHDPREYGVPKSFWTEWHSGPAFDKDWAETAAGERPEPRDGDESAEDYVDRVFRQANPKQESPHGDLNLRRFLDPNA